MNFKTLERITTAIALFGAVLVASNSDFTKFGYIPFLISSVLFIYIGYKSKLESVLITNIAFAGTNVYGLIRFWG